MRRTVDPAERFWDKVNLDLNGCWTWTASTSGDGYGCFSINRVRVPAHRWSYEQLRGPVPDGLDLDHLCRVRSCVNPWHLEPVTRKENVRRGQGHGSETHCPQNHPYDSQNTYTAPRGDRQCRTCMRERTRAASRRRREASTTHTQPSESER